MKFATFAAAAMALVGIASAQTTCRASLEAVPACGLGYILSAANGLAGCGVDDFHCQCSASATVQNAIAGSVASQCGGGQIESFLEAESALCSCASVHPRQSIKPNKVAKQCSASALNVPACAAGYFYSAASSIAGCNIDDYSCQCSASQSVQGAIAGEVASACSDIAQVLEAQSQLCACATSVAKTHPGAITGVPYSA